jgi:hypothetical protein
MEPHRVVVDPDAFEFSGEGGGVADAAEVRPFDLGAAPLKGAAIWGCRTFVSS